MTGARLSLTPQTVNERTDDLAEVHDEYLASDDEDSGTTPPPADVESADLTDDEIIQYAKNGENSEKFERLWQGDTSGYPSHSEADLTLCNNLAFWTGGDMHQIERLFYQSGLVRDKWRNREDYRERTIQKAIQDCPSYYDR